MDSRSRRLMAWIGAVTAAAAILSGVGLAAGWFTDGEESHDQPPVGTSQPPEGEPTATPTGTEPLPDARAVPVESLLRLNTEPIDVLYGDLDGDAVEEIVLASQGTSGEPFFPQPFLDVFAHTGASFENVFDGTKDVPEGAPEDVFRMLVDDPAEVSQQVAFLDLVDFAGDGTPEIAVAILSFGASAGPLEVWVISRQPGSQGPEGFRAEFYEATTRGGDLTREGDRLLLDTGFYTPEDPGCCPSQIEHQVIGLLGDGDGIGILERTFTPAERV